MKTLGQTGEIGADDRETLVGSVLAGRYEIQRRLGGGGMGLVYEARHKLIGKRVAIKVLRPELAKDQQAIARFHREAQAAAAIGSEHIVDVTDFGITETGAAFIAMEFLDGLTLAELLKERGSLPAGRAVGIARQACKALAAAHQKGIIHRDMKSDNVFVTQRDGCDFVKILDFGISKVLEATGAEQVRLTNTGIVMGTPFYMSPEQGRGEQELDHRVDLYALGVILYEMLVGRVPYGGKSVLEVVWKHIHEPAMPPSIAAPRLADTLRGALDAVTLKALAKDPNERFQTAGSFLEALPDPTALPGGEHAFVVHASTPGQGVSARTPVAWPVDSQGATPLAVPPMPGGKAAATRRRNGVWIAAGAVAVGLGVGVFLVPRITARRAAVLPPRSAPTAGPARDPTAPPSSRPAAPEPVTITFRVTPREAEIWMGDERLGAGNASKQISGSPGEHATFHVRAPGWITETRDVPLDSNRDYEVVLRPAPAPPRPRDKAPPGKAPPQGGEDLVGNPYRRAP